MILFFVGSLLATIGVSCSVKQSSEDKSTGDILIIPEHQKLAVINPLITSTTLSSRLSDVIFDGLIQLNERFEVKPRLAQSWEKSEDGRIWTFHLVQGVKFHDGVELTAEDVAFTLEKIRDPQTGSPFISFFRDIESIRVEDRHTLQIVLEKPLPSFLEALDTSISGILPKHLLEKEEISTTTFNQHPIGTGPFKLTSWSETETLLKANEDYFLGRPYLDQIRVIVYPNREAAWSKLMAGEADFSYSLSPDNFNVLKQVPSFKFHSVPLSFYYIIAFNLKEAVFRDQRVRQALNFAVNKEEILRNILRGQGQVAAGTIYPGSWAFNPKIKPYPYNPKQALVLFKEAGWTDHDGDHFLDKDGKPFEFTVHVNKGDDLKHKALVVVQQQLLDIGVIIKVKLFGADDLGFLFERNFQAHFPEIMARGDPDFNYKYWHSSQIKEGFNVSSYQNAKVDRFLEEGRTEFDQERRKAIYLEFQKEILQDPPGIFLFWTNYLVGVHERFKGVKISPVGPFANIREWYVPKAEQKYVGSKKTE